MYKIVELKNTNNSELKELDRILENSEIATVFQPIVNLKTGFVIGYEALSRGPEDSILHNPDKLFSAAEDFNRTWDLESLCRVKAIERATNISKDKYLFINVDPHIFKDEKFKRGFTKEFLAKNNMSPETIIIEITEKTCIEDYKSFRTALDNYIDQGYKIAIDDTGSGYSGLKMLTETKPHFVKIDMDLIRNINVDFFKQALIKCFVSLAEVTNMKLIAEGIETEAELLTLMDLGVYAGQGFFLQRPAGTFLDIPENVLNIIIKHNRLKNNNLASNDYYIGQIARCDKAFDLNTSCHEIQDYFNSSKATGACVTQNNYPIGLIMKHSLYRALATQYGVAIFLKRPISLIIDKSPLIVDFYSTLQEVSKAAMSRADENLYDYVIITKEKKYYGIVTIKRLLEFTTMLETKYAKELNPLTSLPGNAIIEHKLNLVRQRNEKCCLLYLDLDNFKSYNDIYGFENGDKMLKFTSELIDSMVKSKFPNKSFVGHIGGDDFMCIIEDDLDKCNLLCQELIVNFDRNIGNYFNEQDRSNRYIEAENRYGQLERFCITSISIAGLYADFTQFSSIETIAQHMSKLKKQAKSIKGSSFILKEY
ncbi:cyclic diguanylate phosphodiesterase domain protein [Clostridiales bacterium oral taxon 876 str. F0540]|nr:cyclic diguanylate phosphodiesterase domain protein [Clostridiales bacterium oral taxon 876 str. F0540]